ncbi:MAG: ABC transporter ATP-binding protein [Clostridiales bacterium]|jgi:iron complex transport system ATP-binding protein|nr:ABC transporter ATP-binding protein [Clostridiales bacterium]
MFCFETKQLTVGYNGKPLIKDINIQLGKGKILTLIGPNGGGKSTVLKSITKHIKTLSGRMFIGEKPADALTNNDFAKTVSVLLTGKLKTELMTCYDVVASGRYPYTGLLGILSGNDKAQVQAAMEITDAWDLRGRDFSEVSDGQRQRVNLARAICQEPEIIVLDEPTSFLDVRYALELLQTLRDMADNRGITVIMSLHELNYAQKVSDFVCCVKGEYITRCGTPEEIFTRKIIAELYDLQGGEMSEWVLKTYTET